jgi:cholest-4-en-3-one 26-monooxygenase
MSELSEITAERIMADASYGTLGYPWREWDILRAQSPVHPFLNWEIPFHAVTRHEDITEIGRNPDIWLNGPRLIIGDMDDSDLEFDRPPTLIEMDPPMHADHRKLIAKKFTPRSVAKLHPDIERICAKIVDDLLEEGGDTEVDFVERVSAPVPTAVIAWMLGVPESDWKLIFEWTNQQLGSNDPEYAGEEDPKAVATRSLIDMFTYFTGLVEERKKNPKDDLISLFCNAEVGGKPLELIQILAWCQIIMIAGNETTRNGTSGGLIAMIENPDQRLLFQSDPEKLMRPMLEEILRWTSPIIHFARTASRDTELHGKKIRKGEHIALFFPSANRQDDIFDDPYSFRIDRYPNNHLAFGVGEHFCAGAHIARLELEMIFKHLLPRIEEIELAAPPSRLHSNLVGGIKRLPIRYKLRNAA